MSDMWIAKVLEVTSVIQERWKNTLLKYGNVVVSLKKIQLYTIYYILYIYYIYTIYKVRRNVKIFASMHNMLITQCSQSNKLRRA